MRIIHVLRKTLSEGTVASNTLKHGTGGLNIDASRIASDGSHMRPFQPTNNDREVYGAQTGFQPTNHAGGRWPANVILQHLDGCRCDGIKKVKGTGPRAGGSGSRFNDPGNLLSRKGHEGVRTNHEGLADKDGKETVADWICEPGCPVARLDEQSGISGSTTEGVNRRGEGGQFATSIYGKAGPQGRASESRRNIVDSGGASRFYKQVGGEK